MSKIKNKNKNNNKIKVILTKSNEKKIKIDFSNHDYEIIEESEFHEKNHRNIFHDEFYLDMQDYDFVD